MKTQQQIPKKQIYKSKFDLGIEPGTSGPAVQCVNPLGH